MQINQSNVGLLFCESRCSVPFTLPSSSSRPLPLLLCGQSVAFPLAELLRIIPAHMNHREVQTLQNTWTGPCGLSRGKEEWGLRNTLNGKEKRKTYLPPKGSFYGQPPGGRLDSRETNILKLGCPKCSPGAICSPLNDSVWPQTTTLEAKCKWTITFLSFRETFSKEKS